MTYIFIAVLLIAIILLMSWCINLIEENFDLKLNIQEKNRLLEWQDKLIEEMDKN